MSKPKYAFIGNGGMSCGVAVCQAPTAGEIFIWGHNAETVKNCNESRENRLYLPSIPIAQNIQFTANLNFLNEHKFDLILCGVPTQFIRPVLLSLKPPPPNSRVISLSKGLELKTLKRPTEIIKEIWPHVIVSSLSGPAQAEEISRFKPCTLVLASLLEEEAKIIQNFLNTATFRIYHSTDIIGVEIAGALKNVIGIAAGINDGLQFGDNAKSAIITRGCAEIARLGVIMGAKKETFFGLAGMGDLITTCISPYGRNYSLGIKIGKGISLQKILSESKQVAEGVTTVQVLQDISVKYGVEMPIANEVFAVLFNEKNPLQGVKSLMERSPKSEFY